MNKFSSSLIALFAGISLFAQNLPPRFPELQITPAAPEAAAFGTFGTVPISNFTGKPNISIPIFSIEMDGVTIPISLEYDASAVNLDQVPSWLGQGWRLEAGGAITRQINAKDDFSDNGYFYGAHNLVTDVNPDGTYSYIDLNGNSNTSTSHFPGGVGNAIDAPMSSGAYDLQPDMFNLKIPSFSSPFFLDRTTKEAVGHEMNNVQFTKYPGLNPDINGSNKGQSEWELYKVNGTRYVFGSPSINGLSDYYASSVGLTYYRSGAIQNIWTNQSAFTEANINSWFLSEIESYSGQLTSFEYDSFIYDYQVNQMDNVEVVEVLTTPANPCKCPYKNAFTFSATVGEKSEQYISGLSNPSGWVRNFTKCLSKINYNDVEIEFITNTSLRTDIVGLPLLQEIRIKSRGIVIKRFILEYTISSTNNRPWLTKVTEYSATIEFKPAYLFEYSNYDELPSRMSWSQDHWGFYNSNPINRLNPAIVISGQIVNRSADPTRVTYGLLSKVTYPTGGMTLFEFESNSYVDEFGSEVQGGGVRVKKITSTDNNGNNTIKEYSYLNEDQSKSSGVLINPPKYDFVIPVEARTINGSNLYAGACELKITRANQVAQVSYVGYSRVVETINGTLVTEREFAAFPSAPTSNIHVYFPNVTLASNQYIPVLPYQEPFYANGKLIGLNQFRNEQGALTLVYSQTLEYKSTESRYIRGTVFAGTQGDNLNVPNSRLYEDVITIGYNHYCSDYLLSQVTETYFFNNSSISTSKDFDYNDDKLVVLEEYRDSQNNVHKTTVKYPSDFPVQVIPEIDLLVANLRLDRKIEVETLVNGNKVFGTFNKYTSSGMLGSVYRFVPQFPVTYLNVPPYYELLGEITYNEYNKPIEQKINNGLNTSFLWNINNERPIAKAIKASADEIDYNGFEEEPTAVNLAYSGDKSFMLNPNTSSLPLVEINPSVNNKKYLASLWLRANTSGGGTPTVHIKLYKRNANGAETPFITQQVYALETALPTWQHLAFEIDLPALAAANNLNAGEVVLKVEVTNSSSNFYYVDEVRLHPLDALMETYAYKDLVGVISITDTRGNTVNHTYDEFQRLQKSTDFEGNILQLINYHYKP